MTVNLVPCSCMLMFPTSFMNWQLDHHPLSPHYPRHRGPKKYVPLYVYTGNVQCRAVADALCRYSYGVSLLNVEWTYTSHPFSLAPCIRESAYTEKRSCERVCDKEASYLYTCTYSDRNSKRNSVPSNAHSACVFTCQI